MCMDCVRRSRAVTKIFVKVVAIVREACPIQSQRMDFEEVSENEATIADSRRGGEEGE